MANGSNPWFFILVICVCYMHYQKAVSPAYAMDIYDYFKMILKEINRVNGSFAKEVKQDE